MTGHLAPWQNVHMVRAFPRVDAGLFELKSETWRSKLVCLVCGRTGWSTSGVWDSWQSGCRRGHAPCPLCGRQLTVRLDGTPRKHNRCPGRCFA